MAYKEQQDIISIDRAELPHLAARLAADGWRIVHVACTTLAEQLEITYAFDLNGRMVNHRMLVPKSDPVVPSITAHYLAAFAYENELQDLFGMTVTGLLLDFKGAFYRTRQKSAFNPPPAAATEGA